MPERFAAAAAEPSEAALLGVLGQVFGFPAFRGLQLPTIQRLLAGESVLAIMPTGGRAGGRTGGWLGVGGERCGGSGCGGVGRVDGWADE